jgi:hypothetical protein
MAPSQLGLFSSVSSRLRAFFSPPPKQKEAALATLAALSALTAFDEKVEVVEEVVLCKDEVDEVLPSEDEEGAPCKDGCECAVPVSSLPSPSRKPTLT